MLSRTGKYALRILTYLVDHPDPWVQGSQIAGITGIPSNYLSKILNQLRKGGFVVGQKGWGGGFRLEPRAGRRPIAEVLELFDGLRDEGECVFGHKGCDPQDPCPLHPYWEKIQQEFQTMLRSTSVAGLRSGPAKTSPAKRPRAKRPQIKRPQAHKASKDEKAAPLKTKGRSKSHGSRH